MTITETPTHQLHGEETDDTTDNYVLVRTVILPVGETSVYIKNTGGANSVKVQLKDNFGGILTVDTNDETTLAPAEDLRFNIQAAGITEVNIYIKSAGAGNSSEVTTDATSRRV